MNTESGTLAGRHAIVTGGGRGIGAAIASELARLGATLTLMGRDVPRLEETAAEIRDSANGQVGVTRCDVSDEQSVRTAFAEARERFGASHILINNAGQAVGAALVDTDLELWNRLLAVNLTGAFLCTREVLPAMIERREGRIVNIASVAGLRGASHTAAYTASKHGVVGLTRALAAETAKRGITVNAVCPGYTETDMSHRAIDSIVEGRGVSVEEAAAMLARTMPRGRLVQPEEVAATVGWLCSPAAGAVTGEAVVVGDTKT